MQSGSLPSRHGKLFSRFLWAYFRGPDHWAKLRLWSYFRRLTGHPRLTIPYAGGYLTIDERDYLQRMILSEGSYEPEVWSCLESAAVADEVFWDVGGHVGAMSVKALLDPRFAQVHAFEPDLAQARILKLNLRLNSDRGTVHNLALSDTSGSRAFYRATGSNSGMSSLHPVDSGEQLQVRCATIDELVFGEGVAPPTLMKIDVEGWESQVFAGACQLLEKAPPKRIVFESTSDPGGRPIIKSIPEYLARFSYEVEWIRRPSGAVEPNENFCATLRPQPPDALVR
jgi:FkbM family methyltransferase